MIFFDHALNFFISDAETFTHNAAFIFLVILIFFTAIERNGFFQGFAAHDRTVHFFFRKSA